MTTKLMAAIAFGFALLLGVIGLGSDMIRGTDQTTQANTVQPAPIDREALHAEMRAYLLENPEVIMEAVAVLEARQQATQAAAEASLVIDHSEAIFNDGFSYMSGNLDGDITIVEFIDYRCGFCKRAHGEVAKLMQTDDNIKFILKELPILGEQSLVASRFAIATKQLAGNDAYKAMSDAIMEFSGPINEPSLRRLATSFGLDTDTILAHMGSDEVTQEIRKTRELAEALRINGTPSFVINDELIRGFMPYDEMVEIINEKRS